MNVWTNKQSESSGANRKGSWLGALARSLRNSWARFLGGHARSEPSQSPEEALPAGSVPQQEDISAPANAQQPIDPGFALVRENAPELLLPPEEGGTPLVVALEELIAPMEELRDEGNSTSPAVQPPPVEASTPPVRQQASTRRKRNEASRDAGTKRIWFNFFQRNAEASTESGGSKSGETLRENDRESSLAQVRSVISRVFRKANSRNLAEGQEPSFSVDSRPQVPARPVKEDSRRDVYKPSGDGLLLSLFNSRGSEETKEREPHYADLHDARSTNNVELTSSVDRASLKRASKFGPFPSTNGEVSRPPDRFDSAGYEARVAPIQITPRRLSREIEWPAVPRSGNTQSTLDKSLSFTGELPVGKQNFRLEQQPASEPRWPDLPEASLSSDLGWMESFRTREHLHALDVEQQGGN